MWVASASAAGRELRATRDRGSASRTSSASSNCLRAAASSQGASANSVCSSSRGSTEHERRATIAGRPVRACSRRLVQGQDAQSRRGLACLLLHGVDTIRHRGLRRPAGDHADEQAHHERGGNKADRLPASAGSGDVEGHGSVSSDDDDGLVDGPAADDLHGLEDISGLWLWELEEATATDHPCVGDHRNRTDPPEVVVERGRDRRFGVALIGARQPKDDTIDLDGDVAVAIERDDSSSPAVRSSAIQY